LPESVIRQPQAKKMGNLRVLEIAHCLFSKHIGLLIASVFVAFEVAFASFCAFWASHFGFAFCNAEFNAAVITLAPFVEPDRCLHQPS
jgi:hypothetical protein